MYAIIETGGKQYRVKTGDTLKVEKLEVAEGETVEISKILAVGQGDEVKLGQPLVEGAKVKARVLEHGRGEKIIVFKYKSKKNYRRKQGHRQSFTKLLVESIEA